jgi:hypothetical protein
MGQEGGGTPSERIDAPTEIARASQTLVIVIKRKAGMGIVLNGAEYGISKLTHGKILPVPS